jgi:hypothetical protein
MSKKELEVKKEESKELALYQGLMDDAPIHAEDLLIPKILLMQGLSKHVTDGKAVIGDLVNSVTAEKFEKPVEIILFSPFRTWIIFEEINGKLEYREQILVTPENDNWKWEDKENGVTVRRDKTLNYFCLAAKEIDKMPMPYLISFKRTSYIVGKKIESIRVKLKKFNQPLCAMTVKISCQKEKNDKGTFYIFDAVEGRKTTEKELNAVREWKDVIAKVKVTIDDTDIKEEASYHESDYKEGEYKEGDKF